MARVMVSMVLAFALVSCARTDQGRLQQERQARLSTFRPISYHRTGGRNQADEHILISQDGQIVSQTKYGATRAHLDEFQILQLATVFDGWNTLQPSYPGTKPNPEAASISITYGDKTVTATEGADGVPQQFNLARDTLNAIARDLPAQKSTSP